MGKGEMIEIHLESEQKARALLASLQSEASIHAQRLAWLAQRLSQLARESPASLVKLNELNAILDIEMRKALSSHPARETIDSVLTGMITAAGTLEAARAELKKLGVRPTEGESNL